MEIYIGWGRIFLGGIYIDGETPPLDWGRSDESKRKSLQYLKIEQTSTLVSPKKWPSSAQTSVMCNLKMAFVNKHYQLPSMRCKSRKLWCKTSSQGEKQLGVCLFSFAWKSTNLQEKFRNSFKPSDLQKKYFIIGISTISITLTQLKASLSFWSQKSEHICVACFRHLLDKHTNYVSMCYM